MQRKNSDLYDDSTEDKMTRGYRRRTYCCGSDLLWENCFITEEFISYF